MINIRHSCIPALNKRLANFAFIISHSSFLNSLNQTSTVYMKQVIGLISICLLCTTILPAQLSISFDTQAVTVGEEFCMDVTVSGFNDILSFQAQFLQDDSLLTFTRFANDAFPEGLWEDAYAHDARIAWISKDLINGASVADGQAIISVCYLANKSGVSSISIFNDSTDLAWLQHLPLEVYDANESLVEVTIEEGVVVIEEIVAAKEPDTEVNKFTTSITNPLLNESFQLFPNLVNDYLKIIGEDTHHKEIKVYGMDGVLYQHLHTVEKDVVLATSSLSKGGYFVLIETSLGTAFKRFVKI